METGNEKDGDVKKKPKDEGAKAEGLTTGSKSGLASGRTSRASKANQLLEQQGIIIGKTLGSGSYATVKSAYCMNRKHKVAIKIINKKKAFEEYLTKFLPRELDAMRLLGSHSCVVGLFQIIETTSRYYFIMELAECGDLLETIKARKYIREPQAARWFINLHDGLSYMHGSGLVHRDIKCENLILDGNYNLKVTDFGFCKRIGKNKSGEPLLSETYCGSYAYASPEILKGIPYNPTRSEVWSMGVVLFTMVYGKLPFDDTDHKKLLKQVQNKVIFPLKPDVSEPCRILIIKQLSKVSERVPLKNIKFDAWFKHHHHESPEDVDTAGSSAQSDTAEDATPRAAPMDIVNIKTSDVKIDEN